MCARTGKVLPHLAQKCGDSKSSLVRWTLVTSIKYAAVSETSSEVLQASV